MTNPTKTKSTKKIAKTTKATKTRKRQLNQGQSGPKIELSIDDLNENETAVYEAIREFGPIPLAQLAATAFPSNDKAGSWTRNSLRRLVRAELVSPIAQGYYQLGAGADDAEVES